MRIAFVFFMMAVVIGSLFVLWMVTPEKSDPKESPGYKLFEQAERPGLTDSVEEAMKRVRLLLDGAELLQPDETLRKQLLYELDETWFELVSNKREPRDRWEERLRDRLAVVRTKCALPQRGPLPDPPVSLFGVIVFLFFFGALMMSLYRGLK